MKVEVAILSDLTWLQLMFLCIRFHQVHFKTAAAAGKLGKAAINMAASHINKNDSSAAETLHIAAWKTYKENEESATHKRLLKIIEAGIHFW
eukprot:3324526-Karenia_brevis.AAC.1